MQAGPAASLKALHVAVGGGGSSSSTGGRARAPCCALVPPGAAGALFGAPPTQGSSTCCSLSDLGSLATRIASASGAASLGPGSLSLLAGGSLAQNLWLGGVGGLAVYKGLIRRDGRQRARPDTRRTPQMPGTPYDGVELSVATFNIRGIMDRWAEREDVLRECVQEIDADVYAFQEVLTGDFEQDRQLLGPGYVVHGCRAALHDLLERGGVYRYFGQAMHFLQQSWLFGSMMKRLPLMVEQVRESYHLDYSWLRLLRDVLMVPFFGNSLATRLRCTEVSHDVLVLGDFRAAHRLLVHVPASASSDQEAAVLQQAMSPLTRGTAHRAAPPAIAAAAAAEAPAKGASASAALASTSTAAAMSASKRGGRVGAAAGGREHSGALAGPSGGVDGKGGFDVWVVNTHLDHEHEDKRAAQAAAVVQWMDKVKHMGDAIILSGDLNGGPHEAFHALLDDKGFRSAHRSMHGAEPQGTWPSGIQAPFAEDGEPECLDYVYIWEAEGVLCRVTTAELMGTRPADADKTLYPSDHMALRVTFNLQRLAAQVQQPEAA